MNSLLHEVEAQLSSTTPANLVFRSPALSAMFAEVHKTPMPSINCDYSPYDFARQVCILTIHFNIFHKYVLLLAINPAISSDSLPVKFCVDYFDRAGASLRSLCRIANLLFAD